MNLNMRCLVPCALFLVGPAVAQVSHDCTGDTQLEDYEEFLLRAAEGKYDRNQLPPITLPVEVRLRFHSMDTFQGNTPPLAPSHPGNWVAMLNNQFQPMGIRFVFDLFNGDLTYNTFSFQDGRSRPASFNDIFRVLNHYQEPSVINIYLVDDLTVEGGFLGGFATYSFCSRGQGIILRKTSSPTAHSTIRTIHILKTMAVS